MKIYPLDLINHREKIGSELRARLFLSEEKKKIIVAPVSKISEALHQELPSPIVMPFDTSYDELAHQAKVALLAYCHNTSKPFNYIHNTEKLVWPAYKASKLKSAKEFRAYFVQLWFETINTTFRVESSDTGIEHILVGADPPMGIDDEPLGEVLFRVYRCAKQLARVDFVV